MQRLTTIEAPEPSEVIHRAQQLFEWDQAEAARKEGLFQAAEEVGLPRAYLERATAELQARRTGAIGVLNAHPFNRVAMMFIPLLIGLALMLGLMMFRTPRMLPAQLAEPIPIVVPESAPRPIPLFNVVRIEKGGLTRRPRRSQDSRRPGRPRSAARSSRS